MDALQAMSLLGGPMKLNGGPSHLQTNYLYNLLLALTLLIVDTCSYSYHYYNLTFWQQIKLSPKLLIISLFTQLDANSNTLTSFLYVDF